jgi:hypothetical protein
LFKSPDHSVDGVVPRDKQRRGLLELLTSPEHMAGINAWARSARAGCMHSSASGRSQRSRRLLRATATTRIRSSGSRGMLTRGSITEPRRPAQRVQSQRRQARRHARLLQDDAQGGGDDRRRGARRLRRVRPVEKRDGVVVVDAAGARAGRPTWCLVGWQFEGQRTDSMVISAEAPDEPGELVAEVAGQQDRPRQVTGFNRRRLRQ